MVTRRPPTFTDDLVEHTRGWETYRGKPYWDGGAVNKGTLTWGYGHAQKKGEVVPEFISERDAYKLLILDLTERAPRVQRLTASVVLVQHQFDALLSLAFNIGIRRFSTSTLLKFVRAREMHDASLEFLKWVYFEGKISNGLVKRRHSERNMFLFADYTGRP